VAARTHLSHRGCARRTWAPSCDPGDLQQPQPSEGHSEPGQEQRSARLDSSADTQTHAKTRRKNRATHFGGDIFPFRRHSVLFIYIVREPDSQPRRTNCVSARGGRTCSAEGGKHTKTHAKRLPFSRPPSFISCQFLFFFLFFFLANYFLLPNQEPGPDPPAPRMKEN